MDKSCGPFWETRAEDGKLKSNLEWPYWKIEKTDQRMVYRQEKTVK
jgi:hypothetical protein